MSDDEMFNGAVPTLSPDQIEDNLQYSGLFSASMGATRPAEKGVVEDLQTQLCDKDDQIRELQRAFSALVAFSFQNNPDGYQALMDRIRSSFRF